MMKLRLLSVAALLLASTAQAQTLTLDGSCTYSWDASPSTEFVTEYHLYLKKDGIQMPTVTIPGSLLSPPPAVISCKDAGVQADGVWTSNVHAYNGLESDMSNTVTFTQQLVVVKPKPNPPKNFHAQ